MTPYVMTLLVLALASQRLRMPAADGLPYQTGVSAGSAETARTFDWESLRTRPPRCMRHAYAPYSDFPVGAAGLVDDGRVVLGCNVENAAYGVGLCAECGLVSALHAIGGGRLTHFVCVNGDGDVLMPCGRCRQLLFEHGGPDLLLLTVSGCAGWTEVLPGRLRPDALSDYADHAD